VDQRALWQYMYFGYIPDPATAFQSIHKLLPGHLLEFERGEIRIRKYWDLPEFGTHPPQSEEECLEEMEHRLAEAVRIRLIADVPLGALLSGGVDSSTVVALMARASSGPVKTFSIGFKHSEFNEAPYARLVAKRFGTEHHELILDPDVIETVETLTRSLEEPFGDSSMLPTYYISHLARQHVTVALSGDGGDEAFAGYERYHVHLQQRSFGWIPAGAARWYREQVHPRLPYGLPARNLAYSISLPWQERYMEGVSLQSFDREIGLLSDDFRATALRGSDPFNVFRGYLDKAPGHDPVSQLLYLDTKTYLPGDILTKVDRMSMAASLEARAPLLDHKLIEFVSRVPASLKLLGYETKYLLKKAVADIVPEAIRNRPKQGFGVPMQEWINDQLRSRIRDTLDSSISKQRGYINPGYTQTLLEEHERGRRDHSMALWSLFMLELWHRRYVDGAGSFSEEQACVSTTV